MLEERKSYETKGRYLDGAKVIYRQSKESIAKNKDKKKLVLKF